MKRIAIKDSMMNKLSDSFVPVLTPRPTKKPKSSMQIRERNPCALIIEADGIIRKRRSLKDLFYFHEGSPSLR